MAGKDPLPRFKPAAPSRKPDARPGGRHEILAARARPVPRPNRLGPRPREDPAARGRCDEDV